MDYTTQEKAGIARVRKARERLDAWLREARREDGGYSVHELGAVARDLLEAEEAMSAALLASPPLGAR